MAELERVSPKHETVMDVTVEQVARVYARAYMGVISKSAKADDRVEELASLVNDVLDQCPELEKTLDSSLVSHDQKEQLLDRVFGKRVSTDLLNFMKVLLRHGRLSLLRSIARQVKKMQSERKGLIDAEVRVATELDKSLRQEIADRLRKRFGREPVLNIKIDPSLIAGIVVRVGDQVVDASVRTQLEHARRAMIERATEQIETRPERFMAAK
jgi:F-type H+-transporting ATPase subunit delta